MSLSSNIRPTRLEYIRTKRRISIAQKGLKLLKLKRQALILEFFNTNKTAAELRGTLQAELIKGYEVKENRAINEFPPPPGEGSEEGAVCPFTIAETLP